jgi:uncharacterized BrkB/YihY/UPF0761 family membrane protein
MRSRMWFRGAVAGMAGGAAWLIGIMIFFGPAQAVLTEPQWQSEKMLAAFGEAPHPRHVDAAWILPVALLAIGALWGLIYAWLAREWNVSWSRRGLRFAVVSWVLMVPWFEFYLPWNVLHEPMPLVLLEMACWAGVLGCVGMTIAGVEHALRPRAV